MCRNAPFRTLPHLPFVEPGASVLLGVVPCATQARWRQLRVADNLYPLPSRGPVPGILRQAPAAARAAPMAAQPRLVLGRPAAVALPSETSAEQRVKGLYALDNAQRSPSTDHTKECEVSEQDISRSRAVQAAIAVSWLMRSKFRCLRETFPGPPCSGNSNPRPRQASSRRRAWH